MANTSFKPTTIGNMSRAEIDAELMKGIDSLQFGKTYTADEVDAELAKEFGIEASKSYPKENQNV